MTLSRSRFVTLPLALVLSWSIAQIESASAPTPNQFYTISAQPQCTNVIIQIYGRFLPIAHPSPGSVPFPPEVIGELPPDTPTCHLGYPMMADPSQRIHVESEQLYGQIRQTFKHDPVHARLVYQDHNVTSITILTYAFAGTILDRALATEVFDTDPFSSILFSTIGGVLYLGTPHSGSSFLASLPRSVGSFLLEAPLLRDLASPECAKTYKKVLDRNFNILNVVEDTAVSYESASKYDQSRVPELERALFSSEVPIKIVPEAEAHPTVVGKSAIHVSSFLATGLNHLDLSSITNANPELVKTMRQFVLGAGRLAAPRFCNDNLVKSMISSYPRFLLWVPTANQYVYCDGTFTSAINPEVNGLPTIAITAAGRPRRVRSPSYILPLPSFARFETSSSCEDGPAAIYGRGHSFETHNGLRTVHGHRSNVCKLRCLMTVDTGVPQSEVVIRASAEGVGPNKGDPLPTISINNDPIGRKTDHRAYATQHGTCDKLWCTSSEWLLQEERGDLIHTLPSRTSSFEVAMTCESNGSFLSATCRIAKLGFR